MGHVATNDNLQEDLGIRQQFSDDSEFLVIPTTPNNTPEVTMTDVDDTQASHENEEVNTAGSPRSDQEPAARITEKDKHDESEEHSADAPADDDDDDDDDDDEDPYASLDPNTILVIPITNPSAFPIQRLQEVQSQHQPSTHITNMWCHKTPSGPITQVTADVQDGSINHLIIRDLRWLRALGLSAPDYDTLHFDAKQLRLHETFTIRLFPGQRPQKLEEWIMGELVSARHAFLYWLDERRCADPRTPPFAAEAKAIARATRRRWPHVMREIEEVWRLEQGSGGREYSENRAKYLGEDPVYPKGAERSNLRSMFG